ncbi:hypothetical protein JGH11_13420 [Dysgonomonas sp. Marseille-P4677]|uniref:hypothetical protein n=1 Tax=Dysgonomonas sp. Marseille-P4677 TaxID=2364790 RepID=UPI001912FBFA|nr:hypothetical protein [Dysgonomonas sp. Marseille-P4677]MBK5721874.1 hypothetical protein [Dysgonomonas sp. Marseille-P4677]
MVRFIKYTIFSFMVLTIVIGLASFINENEAVKEIRRFNADLFREIGYTDDELSLFCDVAFMHEDTRIRKWDRDIKVEIKNIADLSDKSIAEVDSVIAILAPLLAPIKIERVRSGGNLHVYRKVSEVVSHKIKSHPRPVCLNGMAKINGKSDRSWSINYACIYDGAHSNSQTLLHEFEHALGLDHPIKLYSYYVTIGRSVIPQYFRSKEDVRSFLRQPFYISEQEKKVIKMLYSPEIKAGLHIETFARRMEFTDEDRIRLIPEASKNSRIVIYPSPEEYHRYEIK